MSSVCLAGTPFIEGATSGFSLPFLTIYVVGISVTWLIEWFAIGRQTILLQDSEKAMKEFDNLDADIKECYKKDKILESMKY
jgi:hypothetical protein